MALQSEMSRWLSISVLSCALSGALVGCGQTGPLYLPPEPDEPEEEIDTVVGVETGAEAGLEAGVDAGREGDPMENTGEAAAAPGEAAVDSDVIIETDEAAVDSDVIIETAEDAAPVE